MTVYIVWNLCVDVEEKLGCWVVGMSIGKHPIQYREPQESFDDPGNPRLVGGTGHGPPSMRCAPRGRTHCLQMSIGAGVVR